MFEKGPYEKYIRKHIFFVRHLLVHAMFEKGPYEKYMLFRKFIRLTKHMFFEKVYMFLKKVYMFFEKVCMFFKKYICFLKKYVCFLKKYIFFEKAYIFFVRLLLVHRTKVSCIQIQVVLKRFCQRLRYQKYQQRKNKQ